MNIFVTGATGYIGGSVAAALAERGHRVLGLTRSERADEAVRRLGVRPLRGTLP